MFLYVFTDPVPGSGNGASLDLEEELKSVKEDLKALKNKKEEMQVDEALSTVRCLASRPSLTSQNVLLAAIETLIEIANKANHKDASLFSKSYAICKRYEDNDDFCGLVLKLFGSQEDKKIAAAVSDWAKAKKYEETEKNKGQVKENIPSSSNFSNANMPNYGFGPVFPPHVPMHPMMYPYPHTQPGFFGPRPPVGRGQNRRRKNDSCFYCKGQGHFVANCPKLQGNGKK